MENLQVSIDPQKLVEARAGRPASQVARALGLSRQLLWNYENGHAKPSAEKLAQLCFYYQIPIERVFRYVLSRPAECTCCPVCQADPQTKLRKKKIAA